MAIDGVAPIQQERAFRMWPLLVDVAARRTTITYKQVGEYLGTHHRPVRFVLSVVQDYCLAEKLPPLTILVVNRGASRPGQGFVAWDVDDLDQGFERVYEFPWSGLSNPFSYASAGATIDQLSDRLVQAPDDAAKIYGQIRNRGIAQVVFRRALLKAYDGMCSFCGLSLASALQAAHIISWSRSSVQQRISPSNGILLCASHHSLFDANLLRVAPNYTIRCSLGGSRRTGWTEADHRIAIALDGLAMTLPTDSRLHPAPEYLKQRSSYS